MRYIKNVTGIRALTIIARMLKKSVCIVWVKKDAEPHLNVAAKQDFEFEPPLSQI